MLNANMHGEVNIKVLDNNVIKAEYAVNNQVLDFINPVIEAIVNILGNDDINGMGNTLATNIKTFLGTNRLIDPNYMGLRMFASTFPAIPNNAPMLKTSKPILALANGATAPSQGVGTLDPGSSYIINAQGNNIGYNFIWHFASGTLNNINSLCITPRTHIPITPSLEILGHYEYGVIRQTKSFTKTGLQIAASGSAVNYQKYKRVRITQTGLSFTKTANDMAVIVNFLNHNGLFKIIDSTSKNAYITLAKNTLSNNYELVSIDKTTLVETTINLSCLNAKTMYDFGLIGPFVVILTSCGGSKPSAIVVDTRSNTFKDLTLPDATSSASSTGGHQVITTYDTLENEFICTIKYCTDNYDPYAGRGCDVTLLPDNSDVILTNVQKLDTREFWWPNASLGCSPLVTVADTGYVSGNRLRQYYAIAPDTLLTVCNLPLPISKAEGETLVINYKLFWGN